MFPQKPHGNRYAPASSLPSTSPGTQYMPYDVRYRPAEYNMGGYQFPSSHPYGLQGPAQQQMTPWPRPRPQAFPYYAPVPTATSEHFGGTQLNTDGRRPCCWKRCHVMLDDHTAGGIRRHLLDRHTNDLLPSNAGRSGTSGPIICRWRLENGHTCGGSYQSATTLSRHISSSHMRVGRVTCEWCQTEFSRKDALKRHQKDNCPCRPRGGKSL